MLLRMACCMAWLPRNATRPRPPYKLAVIAFARRELRCATTLVSLQPAAPPPPSLQLQQQQPPPPAQPLSPLATAARSPCGF